jgi:hypothetical protein
MKTKFTYILALLAFQLSLSFGQTSAVPGTISYQGRVYNPDGTLLGAGTPVNRTVIFRIWDSPSATTEANLLYSESQTVTISEGNFSVLVGNGIANTTQTYSYSETSKHSSASPAVSLADVFNGATRYLSVTVANASTISVSDSEISPRQQIVSSAFAFRSKFAEVLGTSASGSSLQVLDNGNVGVGNASPPNALTVTAASSSTATPQLLLTATDTTERLRLGVNDTGNGTGFIQAWKEGSGSQNLTLNSDGGNVGIGVASPLAKLHVNGVGQFRSGTASHGFIQMEPGNNTLAGGLSWHKPGGARLGYMGLNSTDVLLGLENSANFKVAGGEVGIGMDPTNPLSVSGNADFSGRVGIGTTTPNFPLHAIATGYNVARFESGSKGSSDAAFVDFSGGRAYVGYNGEKAFLGSPSGALAQDLVLAPGNVARYEISTSDGTHTWNTGANAGATRMVLSSAGNLGIGTTNPGSAKLSIADGAADPARYGSLQITREASNHTAAHIAFVRAGNNAMGLGYQQNSNWFGFGGGTTGAFYPFFRTDGSKVLIHTGTTTAMLNVGILNAGFFSAGRLTTNGGNGDNTTYSNTPLSIHANGHILAKQFDIDSDERVKTAIEPSDSREDLGTLLGIEIADYKYIDTITNGNRPHKKVIAQQVENVFPQAVNRSTGSIPDIFKGAEIADGWVLLATDLKVGERVRLISEKEESIEEVIEVRGDAFRTAFKPDGEQVFVHGREVEDYRTVDYDAIAMLNVSATQQIKKELDAVKIENARLKNQLAALVAEVAKADEAREARLLAIEQRLLGATKVTVPIAIQNKAAAQ